MELVNDIHQGSGGC